MGLCLGIEFLTGYYVATHPSARDRPEWPPHPARVFMAMAAAYFETGEDSAEAKALEFVESTTRPLTIFASGAEDRSVVTHYVPVNDKLFPGRRRGRRFPAVVTHYVPVNDKLDSVRASFPIFRSRRPREFPRVRPDDPVVYYCWSEAAPDARITVSLRSLCSKVTRIGHSSSLVRIWVADQAPETNAYDRWVPDDAQPAAQVRVITRGSLMELRRLYRADDMAEYDQLEGHAATAKGKAKRVAKEKIQGRFGGVRPQPIRPEFQVTAGYRVERLAAAVPASSAWDSRLLMFRLVPMERAPARMDILSAPTMVRKLRDGMISAAQQKDGSVPEFISGHKPGLGGMPSEQPHCAIIPLPFVGREYADGHILGIAVAMPKGATATERRAVMGTVAEVSKEGLKLGRLGKWKLVPGTELPALHSLRTLVWTGDQRGAATWASVTPVAFDEHPKSKDIDGYQNEIREMIARACMRIGLPKPLRVDISHVSFIKHGVATAYQFPRLARKDGSLRRQLHALVQFPTPVIGPVLLGAGRYRGYGLFRPLPEGEEDG
ncbi:MAG: type I-U CRISPR-associated protein Csb2 [Planctomycetes bacterium]|nr:type I-U CRISPR-associated protein Csb2 [Planctomycetota bacterium]